MWLKVTPEEYQVIISALEHCNLHGLNHLIKSRYLENSPKDVKHTKGNAIKAAQTYFASSDVLINADYVEWEESGDALVMCWQKVPKEYIEYSDCNCKDDKGMFNKH